jgi:hypothetical protein
MCGENVKGQTEERVGPELSPNTERTAVKTVLVCMYIPNGNTTHQLYVKHFRLTVCASGLRSPLPLLNRRAKLQHMG